MRRHLRLTGLTALTASALTLTACGGSDSPKADPAPPSSSTSSDAGSASSGEQKSGADSSQPGGAQSSSAPSSGSAPSSSAPAGGGSSGGAPVAQLASLKKGASMSHDDLTKIVNKALREAKTFHLKGASPTPKIDVQVQCVPALAWRISIMDMEEIHVGGKEYSRMSASGKWSTKADDDTGADDDHPCNWGETVPDESGLKVVDTGATSEGKSGLIHLKSTAKGPKAYDAWIQPDGRPVRLSGKAAQGRPNGFVYEKYGEPVQVKAPAGATSSASPKTGG